MVIRRLVVLTSALAVALPLAAVAAAPADAAGARPGGSVTNTNAAIKLLQGVADFNYVRGTVASARSLALHQMHGRIWKGLSWAGKIHDHRFTFTYLGDQACLDYTGPVSNPPTEPRVTGGTCTARERHPKTSPEAAARRIAALSTRLASSKTKKDETALLDLSVSMSLLPKYARAAASKGVQISGVVDANNDHLDDDGRVTFRRNGRAVCAELPITRDGKARVYRTDCRNLPTRDTTAAYKPVLQVLSGQRIQMKVVRLDQTIGSFMEQYGIAADQLSPTQVAAVLAAVHPMTATHPSSTVWVITDPTTGCTGTVTWPQDQLQNSSAGGYLVIACPQ